MDKSFDLELLDNDLIPKEDLFQNLKELKIINTLLGGHKVIIKGLRKFGELKKLSILEIGSGGGDNLQALKNKFPENTYIGLDLKEDCVIYAEKNTQGITYICNDYRDFKSEKPVDIIFNSLFCHHFRDNDLIEMLKWMNKHSEKGFYIGDLHRHSLAYYAIKFLTSLFSKSYLVKNDAPLSVKRGFTKSEWEILLKKAGIKTYNIQWCWAFRHLIWVKK